MKISSRIFFFALTNVLLAACTTGIKPYDDVLKHNKVGAIIKEESYSDNLKFPGGKTYQGPLKNGYPEGQGTLIVPGIGKITSKFNQGRIAKEGVLTYQSGDYYKGELKEYLPHGNNGTITLNDGSTLTDLKFKQGKLIYALQQWEDTSGYRGGFKQSYKTGFTREGKGISYDHPTQMVNRGEWQDGRPAPTNLSYKWIKCEIKSQLFGWFWEMVRGECKNGNAHGNVEAVTNHGERFLRGRFENGYFVKGTYQSPTEKIRGEWKRDVRHGWFDEFENELLMYSGSYKDGERSGSGTCRYQGSLEKCKHLAGKRVDKTHTRRIELAQLEKEREEERRRFEKEQRWLEMEQKRLKEEQRARQRRLEQEQRDRANAQMFRNTINAFTQSLQDTMAEAAAIDRETNRLIAQAQREQDERLQAFKQQQAEKAYQYAQQKQAYEDQQIAQLKAQSEQRQREYERQSAELKRQQELAEERAAAQRRSATNSRYYGIQSPTNPAPRNTNTFTPTEKIWSWEENKYAACKQECRHTVSSRDTRRVPQERAVKACESGCSVILGKFTMNLSGILECRKADKRMSTACNERVGSGLATYCMEAKDIWKSATGCYGN